jgi:hypothetical protein
MPDVHWGIGATVGSVIPTKGAIFPAAVGVDIGSAFRTICGRCVSPLSGRCRMGGRIMGRRTIAGLGRRRQLRMEAVAIRRAS